VVEDKGSAVTFHFRAAPDVDAARVRVTAAADAIDIGATLARSVGRRSLELRAAGASDKGTAMSRLIHERHPDLVIALGDDPSDALAFEALRKARAGGQVRSSLAVAVLSRPEISMAIIPAADIVLTSALEAARFLGRLAR
jgi:trehalose-phosphatase